MSSKPGDGWIRALWSRVRDQRPGRMRVAESLSLGGKRSLVLVECDGHALLVGCGPEQVSCLLLLPSSNTGLAVAHCRQAGHGSPE